MGSIKNQKIDRKDEKTNSNSVSDWVIRDIFKEHLSDKLKKNDLASYWIIRDLYHHYLQALNENDDDIPDLNSSLLKFLQ